MSTNKNQIKKALHFHRLDEDIDAIEILESDKLAEVGDAQLLLGQIYYRAHKSMTGVSRSYPKSRKHLLKALELGNSEAANELADMYYYAYGVKENYKKAEFYWQQAASAGNEMAQFDLANYYYDHLNEKIDEAIKLYKTLIKKDEFTGNSYLKLGRIYYRGLGVNKDVNEAISWLTKGVEVVDGNSCMDLAYIYYRGDDVEKDVEKAISLVETAGTTEWLKDDAVEVLKLIRNGTLFNESVDDIESEEVESIYNSDIYENISLDEEDDEIDDEADDVIRTAENIARRALALAAVVSCAYGDHRKNVAAWLKKEGLWKNVTPLERDFLLNESTEKSRAGFTWKIEALVPLLWVINKLDKMPAINKQCDTEPLKKAVIWSPNPTQEYISSSVLRDEDEISEEYEKIYEAHWTVRDAQLNNKSVPKKYDAEVVSERHYGFNWAIGYMGQSWDEISTDT